MRTIHIRGEGVQPYDVEIGWYVARKAGAAA